MKATICCPPHFQQYSIIFLDFPACSSFWTFSWLVGDGSRARHCTINSRWESFKMNVEILWPLKIQYKCGVENDNEGSFFFLKIYKL